MPAVPPQSLAMERAARPTVPSPFILRSMLLTGLLRLLQCHEVLNGLHLSAPVAGFGEGARTAGGQAMAPRSCFRRARPKRWRINHRYAVRGGAPPRRPPRPARRNGASLRAALGSEGRRVGKAVSGRLGLGG